MGCGLGRGERGGEMMNESTDMLSSVLILVARKLKRGVKREVILGLRGLAGKIERALNVNVPRRD